MKFPFKFRVALPIPSQMTWILRKRREKYSDQNANEWNRTSGGNPRGQQGVTVMTQQKTGGGLFTYSFSQLSLQANLEKRYNLQFMQKEEFRNANRLLNTEKIIYFQHSYHYHSPSAIGGVKKFQWNYKLRIVITLLILIWVNNWSRNPTRKTKRPTQISLPLDAIYLNMPRAITIVATNPHIRGCHGSSSRPRILPFDDYSSQPSSPLLTPSPGSYRRAKEGENYENGRWVHQLCHVESQTWGDNNLPSRALYLEPRSLRLPTGLGPRTYWIRGPAGKLGDESSLEATEDLVRASMDFLNSSYLSCNVWGKENRDKFYTELILITA